MPVEAAKDSFTLSLLDDDRSRTRIKPAVPASPAFQEPTAFIYTGEKMIPTLNCEVEEFKESLYGFQYTLDYTTVFLKLCRKLGAGKTAKLTLDRKTFSIALVRARSLVSRN